MNDFATRLLVWLNVPANWLGRLLLAPVGWMPGSLSATLVALASGIAMLLIVKRTSNQQRIAAVRRDIGAQLLAIRLFNESPRVVLGAQGRLLADAVRLLVYLLPSAVVMTLPMLLLLAQVGLWYQARPLAVGEETVVTVVLNDTADAASLSQIRLAPSEGYEVTGGPVRAPGVGAVFWRIRPAQNGVHQLNFEAFGRVFEKELVVGDGLMRVSVMRPGWNWLDVLVHPAERPFDASSPVQSVAVEYPARESWTHGTDTWLVYWFVASLAFAFLVRRPLGVHL